MTRERVSARVSLSQRVYGDAVLKFFAHMRGDGRSANWSPRTDPK
jgi:hypothetical protein